MITVIGLSGSLRSGSYNTAVLRGAAAMMPDDSEMKIESIAGIPLYNGDDETHMESGAGDAAEGCDRRCRRAAPRNPE